MPAITDELRIVLREFKSSINSFNFVIDFKVPPFPVGSIESYKAQIDLANEYLAKYPSLNSEEFNYIGTPLYVKNCVSRRIEQEQVLSESSRQQGPTNALLWDAYMALENGSSVERQTVLGRLKKHFDTIGHPGLSEQ